MPIKIALPQDEYISHPFLRAHQVELVVRRFDLIHPKVHGNKWYKLKYNLEAARQAGHHTLLSFGGAYSNHIYALAMAGEFFDFKTIGLIRGEEHTPLNPHLKSVTEAGMRLDYLSRSEYRQKHTSAIVAQFERKYGDFYLLPEGGSNAFAVKGCQEMLMNSDDTTDHIFCAVGTGATLAGLVLGAAPKTKVWGVSVLKGGAFLNAEVQGFLGPLKTGAWEILSEYHFGGYAKTKPRLAAFIQGVYQATGIPLEHVYTGKLAYALWDQIKQGKIKAGSRVLFCHTGGVYPWNRAKII